MKKVSQGFTLIELLVVIGIIGLLATLAVVAFGSARAKSRDAKRVADSRSIVSGFAAASQDGNYLCTQGCGAGLAAGEFVSKADICTLECGPGSMATTTNYVNLSLMKDPDQSATLQAMKCTGANSQCNYALGAGATLDNFQLFFFTEQAVQGIKAGAHTAGQTGILQ